MAEEQVAVSEQPAAPSVLNAPADTAEPGNWRDQLPDDLKEHQALSNISDVGTLAKTMIHAQSMVGAEKLAVPGKWATDDDWKDVYDKLGRPDDATGYEFDFGEATPDEEFVSSFRDIAHSAGLNDRQAQKLGGWYMEAAGKVAPLSEEDQTARLELARTETRASLQKEYGNAFNERMERGDRLLEEYAAADLLDLKTEDGLPLVNHPAFVKTVIDVAHYITESISEDKLVGKKDSNALTPGAADKQIQHLMRPDSPYWDASHPSHASTVQEVLALQEQKWPEEPAAE